MPDSLLHSPADIIRQLLVDLGLGNDSNSNTWPTFVGSEPGSPDNVLTVFNTAGRDQGRHMIDGTRQTFPGVQIRVRSALPAVGYSKAGTIADALDASVYNRTVNVETINGVAAASYTVHALSRTTDVLDIGKDVPNSRRSIYTINATVTLKRNS